jgi:hypothetical protein
MVKTKQNKIKQTIVSYTKENKSAIAYSITLEQAGVDHKVVHVQRWVASLPNDGVVDAKNPPNDSPIGLSLGGHPPMLLCKCPKLLLHLQA